MNLTNNQSLALFKLYPSVVTVQGDIAYDQNGSVVEYDMQSVQAYVDAHEYIEKRRQEYPPIGDQLDALWKGGSAAETMLSQVMAVKAKYPKTEGA